jgi:hypothetical protein
MAGKRIRDERGAVGNCWLGLWCAKGKWGLLCVNRSMDEQNKAGENGVPRTVTVYSV